MKKKKRARAPRRAPKAPAKKIRARAPAKKIRALIGEIGERELARRTGLSQKALRAAAQGKRASRKARAAIASVEKRRASAKKGAKTRAMRRTRLPEEAREKFSVEELARKLGAGPKQVKRWIEKGGAPRAMIEAARMVSEGREPYSQDWESGTRRKATGEEIGRLEDTLRAFLEARRSGTSDEIKRAFRAWRRAKNPVRESLARESWRRTVNLLAGRVGLPDTGAFSTQRFIDS